MITESNPYAAPQATVEDASGAANELERIRRHHLNAETTIKSLGALSMFGGVMAGFSGLTALLSAKGNVSFAVGVVLGSVAVAGLLLWTGLELRRLKPAGRNLYSAGLVLMLVSFIVADGAVVALPLGFWVLLFLYALWSRKARVVVSEHYRLVVMPATPHIKYRTPVWIWVLLALLVAVAVVPRLFPKG